MEPIARGVLIDILLCSQGGVSKFLCRSENAGEGAHFASWNSYSLGNCSIFYLEVIWNNVIYVHG